MDKKVTKIRFILQDKHRLVEKFTTKLLKVK